MKEGCVVCALLVLSNIKLSDTFSQYLSLNRKTNRLSSCDNKSDTSLVEHFFNVIFAEFHNTPPICVCVQMCPYQSTYCYPNGCIKTDDTRKKYPNSQSISSLSKTVYNDTVKPIIFLFEKDKMPNKNYITDYIEGNIAEKKVSEKSEKTIGKDLEPNPFKDRYKMVLKYKRLPKVEMRYNLREHVKTMKSDKVKTENNDMSSQRWPKGKHWLHSRQLLESIPLSKVVDAKAKKFYMFTENDPEKGTSPKYLKRDLTTTSSEDGLNVESVYVYQTETAIDSSNYSVETMIENLIESSFEGLTNLVNLETNNTLNHSFDENSSIESVLLHPLRNESLENSTNTETIYHNETGPYTVYKKNDRKTSNENGDVDNKNITQSSQSAFLEIIAKMSNKIEKQNNASIDIINRITGNNLRKIIPYPANVQQDIKIDNKSTTLSDETTTTEVSKLKRDITIIDLPFYPLIQKFGSANNDSNKSTTENKYIHNFTATNLSTLLL